MHDRRHRNVRDGSGVLGREWGFERIPTDDVENKMLIRDVDIS